MLAAVHELSIAHSLVELVQASLPAAAVRVTSVDLRVGALAGLVPDALAFCYEAATRDTLLDGSTLNIEYLPVVIHCAVCATDRTIEDEAVLRCPACGSPSGDVRQGRELDLASFGYDAAEDADP